jgi:hypothetical protein
MWKALQTIVVTETIKRQQSHVRNFYFPSSAPSNLSRKNRCLAGRAFQLRSTQNARKGGVGTFGPYAWSKVSVDFCRQDRRLAVSMQGATSGQGAADHVARPGLRSVIRSILPIPCLRIARLCRQRLLKHCSNRGAKIERRC